MWTLKVVIVSIAVNLAIFILIRQSVKKYRYDLKEYIKEHNWLHPNSITIWRCVIGLVATLCFVIFENRTIKDISIFIFTLSAFFDGVDGLIARECKLDTEWGKWLDPFADKITYLAPLTYFTFGVSFLNPSLFNLTLFFEFCNQISRQVQRWLGIDVAARSFGKIKACFYFGLVIYCATVTDGISDIFGSKPLEFWGNIILAVCTLLSFLSIAEKFIGTSAKSDKAK